MTDDPLDRIAWQAKITADAIPASIVRTEDVLALVEVARAARDLSAICTPKDPALRPLRAALARLDGPR